MKRRTFLSMLGGTALVPLVPAVAIPAATGRFYVGQMVSVPSASGGIAGWVCTVTGNPPTWTEIDLL